MIRPRLPYNNTTKTCEVPLGKSDLERNLHFNRDGLTANGMYVSEYMRAYTWPAPMRVTIHSIPHTNTPMVNAAKDNTNLFLTRVKTNGCWSRLEEVVDELIKQGMGGPDVRLVQKAVQHRRLDNVLECANRYMKEKKSLLLKQKKPKKGRGTEKRSRMLKLCTEFLDVMDKLKRV